VIEEGVQELKRIIVANDGRNAADRRFAEEVDALVSAVYDDIGEISRVPLRPLFDLFVIKVLYVGRQSRHADVVEYLGEMLESFLHARALFPEDEAGKPRRLYFSDMADPERAMPEVEDLAEAYRTYADMALFVGGVFRDSGRSRTRGQPGALRRRTAPAVDSTYYATTGRAMYSMSARTEHAACAHRPGTLAKMGEHIEVYMDALTEMSERYLMGLDRSLIADKMLDAFNRHRHTHGDADLAAARRYAALLGAGDAFGVGGPTLD
jgi:hypothetical protein